ncbi:hypothetical protein C2S51_017366, partial [Perilla frutescens var. frutescens]
MEGRQGQLPAASSSQPQQQARPSVVVYAIPEVLDTIRATLHAIGGDAALESFRSGCFGHFLDYRVGVVQKKAIHGLMSREVHMSDCALEGRETWEAHDREAFGRSVQGTGNCQRCSRLREGCEHIVRIQDDLVPGSELSSGSMGVDTGGGCGEVEFISLGGVLLLGTDAFHQHPPMQATGYRRERPRIWACDVIPDLAREIGVHTGQLTLPRALRWTPRDPTADLRTLLQGSLRVVSFVPSREEMATPYFRNMQLQAGAQSVRSIPSRSTNKKKMLANATSCCSTSAEEALRDEPDPDYIPGLRSPTEDALEHTADPIHRESPPRAWGKKRSRRDRSQSSGEPSESFLQRVVDAMMPRVRELIDTTIAPCVQEYVDRAIDQALAGLSSRSRRSPTPEVRDRHSPEPSDRSAAHRAPTPSLER